MATSRCSGPSTRSKVDARRLEARLGLVEIAHVEQQATQVGPVRRHVDVVVAEELAADLDGQSPGVDAVSGTSDGCVRGRRGCGAASLLPRTGDRRSPR